MVGHVQGVQKESVLVAPVYCLVENQCVAGAAAPVAAEAHSASSPAAALLAVASNAGGTLLVFLLVPVTWHAGRILG